MATAAWLGQRLQEPHRFKYMAGAKDQPFLPATEPDDQLSRKCSAVLMDAEMDFMVCLPLLKTWDCHR